MEEYKALIQGLKKALELNVEVLVVYGDSEIIVHQVCNSIHCVSEHLRDYQKEVWNIISEFEYFNIKSTQDFRIKRFIY